MFPIIFILLLLNVNISFSTIIESEYSEETDECKYLMRVKKSLSFCKKFEKGLGNLDLSNRF